MLGVVQGLTEFLPVSSSGHLAIAEALLGIHGPGVTLEVAFHMGTLLAVFVYFRREIGSLIRSFFLWCGSVLGRKPEMSDDEHDAWRLDLRIVAGIILGSIPTGIMGVTGKDFFESFFDRVDFVGGFLLVTATFLVAGEFLSRRYAGKGRATSVAPSWWQSLIIGVFQGMAITPGISRSGSTVSAAMGMGIEPVSAARFSFLLGIPAMLGAAVLSFSSVESIPSGHIAGYLAGTVVAALIGYVAIATFISALRRGKLLWFALYCFLMGSAVIIITIA